MADHLTLPEAIEQVGKLLRQFPSGKPQDQDGYIGALAVNLLEYPRIVAVKCCGPLNGLAAECEFLPTVAKLVSWCSRETAGMRRPVDREDDDAAIINRARERHEDEIKRVKAIAEKRETEPRFASYEAMVAHYGPDFGITNSDKPPPDVPLTLKQIAEKYNVPLETVEALPDIKNTNWKRASYFEQK